MNKMLYPELPYYLQVNNVVEGDTVSIVVESRIHLNREIKLPTQYSVGFVRDRPKQFRSEVLLAVVKRYGLKLPEPHYS